MTGLLFAHPEWLAPGLVAVTSVAGVLLWAATRSRRSLRDVLGETALRAADPRRQVRIRTLRDACLIAALALVLVALLGPRLSRETIQLSTGGIDLVVLLDVSRSMDARDVPPSRFDAARRAAQTLLGGLGPGDRAALAVFSGRGVLLTPLTSDHAALDELVGSIETDLVKPGGSNLAGGIVTALEAFEPVDERPRTIFVISDGESQGHTPSDAIVPAVRANTRVFAAAFGTEAGATIPDHGVPLRDSTGEIVTSRRRLRGLEELTGETGGHLFAGDEWGSFDAAAALRELHAPVSATPGEFVAHPVTVPMVVPFAIFAGALLLLEWIVRGGGLRVRRPIVSLALACALWVVGSVAAKPGEPGAERPPAEAAALLRAGLDRAANGSWPRARASFLAAALAARDPEIAAVAYYDLGVAALREKDFEAARDAFLDSLAWADPDTAPDRVARAQWNLEWTLGRLADPAPLPEAPDTEDPSQEPQDREDAEPDPHHEPPAPSEPSPDDPPGAHPRAEAAGTPPEPPPQLDEEARNAWLARITDDPRRALLSAAFEPHEDRKRRKLGRPTW